jgi:hypothetical protein
MPEVAMSEPQKPLTEQEKLERDIKMIRESIRQLWAEAASKPLSIAEGNALRGQWHLLLSELQEMLAKR